MSQVLGITFPLQLENNGYFGTNKNLIRQIKSNLKNLIRTKKGERVHQPNFGCDIHRYLFEQNTPVTVQDIYEAVASDVAVWMPFLEITDVKMENTTEDVENYTIKMSVRFQLKNNPAVQDTIVLTF